MSSANIVQKVKAWLSSERLIVKEQKDERADVHFLIKYPHGPQGHMFAVVIPKGRDLVACSSMTRVDLGQQEEMKKHMEEDGIEWDEWIHDSRLQLIKTSVDWGMHMGHVGDKKPGPLQAFNVSLPIWFDGLTKNELMQTLRKLWLAKLGLIHEIKYAYGPGKGESGPVDDWADRQKSQANPNLNQASNETQEIEFNDEMSFGSGFDPSEWA
jgi:hypothetical protein